MISLFTELHRVQLQMVTIPYSQACLVCQTIHSGTFFCFTSLIGFHKLVAPLIRSRNFTSTYFKDMKSLTFLISDGFFITNMLCNHISFDTVQIVSLTIDSKTWQSVYIALINEFLFFQEFCRHVIFIAILNKFIFILEDF